MNYGLQLATSSALTSLYRMDVLSNNLANLNTPAFKPDIPVIRQRDTAKVEDGLSLPSNAMLERLGGGVMPAPNVTRFEQGPLTSTGNELDLAIRGEGFFVLRDESDRAGDLFRFTRDGRFVRDAQSRMVSATTGLPVMDTANRPIIIASDAPVRIEPDGSIRQNGNVIGQIQVTDVGDKSRLTKLGHSMFLAPADVVNNRKPATGHVVQHEIEGSIVDPVASLTAITEAQRSVEIALNMMKGHDRIADRAINGLGRVA